MYKTEAAFSKSLSTKLAKAGFDVVRIESHNTSNGIPDMFVQGHGSDFWIELKNDPHASVYQQAYMIKWRPGQQGFGYMYHKMHKGMKQTLTVQACVDGIIIIPMTQLFKADKVCCPMYVTSRQIKEYNVAKLLDIIAHVRGDYATIREAIIWLADNYYPGSMDYDPESLWPGCDSNYNKQQFFSEIVDLFFNLENVMNVQKNYIS